MSALHNGGRGGLKFAAWPTRSSSARSGRGVVHSTGRTGLVRARPPAEGRAHGHTRVGRLEQTFVDDSRPTKGKQGFGGAPNRTLHTTIYYPARGKSGDAVTPDATPDRKDGPYPMILYSHGHNSFGAEFEPLLRQWASAGYVIAAPDYPLSNKHAPGGADGPISASSPPMPASSSTGCSSRARNARVSCPS